MIRSIIQLLYTPWGISILATISCLFFYLINSNNQRYKLLIKLIFYSLLLFVAYKFLKAIDHRLNIFFLWDFTAWYLWGKVASLGLNFYLPENSQSVFAALNLPSADYKDFIEAIVNVGFYYPPPTMLYFVGLGFLSFDVALKCWTIFILLFLAGSIYLTYKFHDEFKSLHGIALIMLFFLLYPSVNFTITCSQTNFHLLFLLLLMEKYAERNFAGILLALAFFTKPFMLIFGLYFLITKNWKAIAYFIGTTLILSGLSMAVFGFDTFVSYFTNNATPKLPPWQFSEDINQSLHAVLIRHEILSLKNQMAYTILSVIFLGATFLYSTFLNMKKQREIIWPLLLLASLIIYPGTLSYYAVLLLFILFKFIHKSSQLYLPHYIVIPLTGVAFYLSSVSVFLSMCILLGIVLIKSFINIKLVHSSGI